MADGEEVPPTAAADIEELEPLFDYSRVRPTFDFRFDDSDLEKSDIFVHCNKRPKLVDAVADDADAVEGDKANEKGDVGVKKAAAVNLDEEDWLAPPPLKPVARANVCKDKTLQPRLEKQEVAKLAEDTYQKVVETVKKDLAAKKPPETIVLDELSEPQMKERIRIMIQDKDVKQQFRVCKDEKFDKLFKAYAKKVELNPSNLTFVFDGDKINPASTPQDLDLEDEDMIEVRHKPTEHVILHKQTEAHVKKAREKILITMQDKGGKLQFRVSKDEKFDKLFKAYAKKVQLSPSDLTFVFDGDKINSASTPQDLDLEDDDMIEVRRKSS